MPDKRILKGYRLVKTTVYDGIEWCDHTNDPVTDGDAFIEEKFSKAEAAVSDVIEAARELHNEVDWKSDSFHRAVGNVRCAYARLNATEKNE